MSAPDIWTWMNRSSHMVPGWRTFYFSVFSSDQKKILHTQTPPHSLKITPCPPTHLPLYSSGNSWEEDCVFSLGFNWLNAFSVQMLPGFWEDAHVQEIQLLPLWGWDQTHLHCQCQTFSVRNNQPILFNIFALHTRHLNYVWHVKHFYQYHLKHNIKFQALRHLREIITVHCVLTMWATSVHVRGGAWKQGEA